MNDRLCDHWDKMGKRAKLSQKRISVLKVENLGLKATDLHSFNGPL